MWYEHKVICHSKLGIVVAAYNAEKFLAKTLESIRQMTYENYVCVIVDDGSTDSTRIIAESFVQRDVRFRLTSIENSGPCVARNLGYRHMDDDVEYIVFTDADDVIFPGTYKHLIEILDSSKDFVAVHGLGTFIDELDQVDKTGMFESVGLARKQLCNRRIVDLAIDQPTDFESLVLSSTVFPPGLVVHRKYILELVGLFDPDSRYAEDWDLLLRVSRFGEIGFVPFPVLYYRRHQNNVGSSPHVPLACKQVWRKTYFSSANSQQQRRVLILAFRAKNLEELRVYVSGLVNPKNQSRLRCLRGIIGCTSRLIVGRP